MRSMSAFLQRIKIIMDFFLRWSEVWALLIPIASLYFLNKKDKSLCYVKLYVFLAFFFNIVSNVISNQKTLGIKLPFDKNVFIYNIHSIARLLLFSLFFIKLKQHFLSVIKIALPPLFLCYVFIEFVFIEPLFGKKISSNLHTAESLILLFYCLQFYLFLLKDEKSSFSKTPEFWIVTGLSILVVCSFPIYLYYDAALASDTPFAIAVWNVQKISFIIFCVFIGKAFYVSRN